MHRPPATIIARGHVWGIPCSAELLMYVLYKTLVHIYHMLLYVMHAMP